MIRILKTSFYTRIDVPFRELSAWYMYALTGSDRISTRDQYGELAPLLRNLQNTPGAINISLARPFRECSIEVGHSAGARLGCH